MKTKRDLTILLIVLLAIALISTSVWAKRPVEPTPNECGLTGTWMGDAENDLTWLGIQGDRSKIKTMNLPTYRTCITTKKGD